MSVESVSLYHRELGDPERPPLMLLHGLFGVSSNWMGVVKLLQQEYRLILPDLRNHGRSPHHPVMDYPAMAADLEALMVRLGLESVSLLGHSMGGKAAMWLSLNQPERVGRLLVADIAPVTYSSRFEAIFEGLRELPLSRLVDRETADQLLAKRISQRSVRQYLLQNLLKQHDGWQWRFNLPVLDQARGALAGFPAVDGLSFAGKTLFLYGEKSDYVRPEHWDTIGRLFPLARLRLLPAAGHWVYADQPEAFARAVKAFFK